MTQATHGGKGSGQRARLVDHKKFSDNWDLAFSPKPKEPIEPTPIEPKEKDFK